MSEDIKPIVQLLKMPINSLKPNVSLHPIHSITFLIIRCKNAFYSYDSQLSNRKTSLGYGHKSDFTKTLTCSPASTKYGHKSLFEESKNRGKSFGLSRDQSPDRSYLIPQLNKVPGPGQYENQVNTKMTISFSMRPQVKDFIKEKITIKDNPGPGSYTDVDL